MGLITIETLKKVALDILNKQFAHNYPPVIEYHARRTEHDPRMWRVLRLTMLGEEVINTEELATDLKRNRAQALVKLMRSTQDDDRA